MTTIEVLQSSQTIVVDKTDNTILHRVQNIIVSPIDQSVTIVNGGPVGPKGAPGDTGIVISATAPVNTDVLWVDTTTSGVIFETELRSDTVSSYTYLGIAALGSLEAQTVWKVTRISLVAPITSAVANNISWNNRFTATYT